MVPNQEDMAVRVKNTIKEWIGGKTGVIPCLNGFTAEVREFHPNRYGNSWCSILALVPKDFPIDSNSVSKVDSLRNKDDPTKKIFGIHPCGAQYNVKKISCSGCPPTEDVIHIRYDKQERTVSFKCSTFEYR